MSYNEVKGRGTADFPVELYCVSRHSPEYNMAHHWHSDIEILRVVSGTLCLNLNNCDYFLKSGDVAFINSEVVHGATPDNCVYQCIVFNPEEICQNVDVWQDLSEKLLSHTLYIKEYFESETPVAIAAEKLFCEMEKQDGNFSKLSCLGLLLNVFGELEKQSCYSNSRFLLDESFFKNEQKLKKVLQYIRTNFAEKITLSDMAKECDMSSKYFCSYFKKMTKMSPTEYLLFYRVEKSARLLIKTDMPITEVAYSCGFSDLSYFIKMFKRHMGLSPGKFRKLASK